jgi:hypothetical protein
MFCESVLLKYKHALVLGVSLFFQSHALLLPENEYLDKDN